MLRHGIVYAGHEKAEFRLAYFRPASGLNADLEAKYQANRLTVTRQLPYDPSSTKTLDLGLFLNGIPVATAEIKNHLTGQTAEHAKSQYRRDRDPRNALLRRAIVHFAVDTEQVYMTTRLSGDSTRFLPFNRGNGDRAGNPARDGYRTGYLWEEVWSRDAWIDLLARFVFVRPIAASGQRRFNLSSYDSDASAEASPGSRSARSPSTRQHLTNCVPAPNYHRSHGGQLQRAQAHRDDRVRRRSACC